MFVSEIIRKLKKDELIRLAEKEGISIALNVNKSDILALFEKAAVFTGKPETTALLHPTKKTKIVLLPKNPLWGFAYWKTDIEELRAASLKLGTDPDKIKHVIRVFNFRKSLNPEEITEFFFDEEVSSKINSKYIRLGIPGAAFYLEFGLSHIETKQFLPLCASNSVLSDQSLLQNINQEKWIIPNKNTKGYIEIKEGREIENIREKRDLTYCHTKTWTRSRSYSSLFIK